MIDETVLRETIEAFCDGGVTGQQVGLGSEWVIDITPSCLPSLATRLLETHAIHHLTTITGLDAGEELEVLYHFWSGRGLTLRTRCPRRGAELPSLVPILPAADWYEREVYEMLGVRFVGHPDLQQLVLPDDWDGPPPLLADERP